MPTASLVFRVFISSTFDDLIEERDALQRDVFPRLAVLCEAHGAKFQSVDLRWGIRDEAVLGRKTMEICLAEVERCQRTGVRPNFIILLGDRYGVPPLPARIDAREFAAITAAADPQDRQLIARWYERDDNAVPPVYLPSDACVADAEDDAEDTVRRVLSRAARLAGLPPDARLKYEASATHQEIIKGLGATPEDRADVFVFCRAAKSDAEPTELRALKEHLLTQLGPNFRYFDAGDMTAFCASVRTCCEEVIAREVSRVESRSPLDLEQEIHQTFADERSRHFVGRDDELAVVREYLGGSDSRVLVLHGASGAGKSTVIAKAATAAAAEIGRTAAVVVCRFIGVSPAASTGLMLLRSLCDEIGRSYEDARPVPWSFNELVAAFLERLGLATASRPLAIFIDALDWLSDRDPASALTWLPSALPPHCRIVVSAIDVPRILENSHACEIRRLPIDHAEVLLSSWLESASRTLQHDQRAKLLACFTRSGLPLYLKLAFEQARHWRSFDHVEHCELRDSLDGIVGQLFDRLSDDRNHGGVLVERSLRYLATARYGLTEREMLDLLSRDDEVWRDFSSRAHYQPPERRLPMIVWSRLHHDLEPYLAEHADSAGTLLTFYHRQLAERLSSSTTTGARTAGPVLDPQTAHDRIAGYFRDVADPDGAGSWTGASSRALTELPVHLAGAGVERESDLHRLLTSLPYLNARVSTGGVYALAEDYALTRQSNETIAWRNFLHRHAQRLNEHQHMLVALVQHEGFPTARGQVTVRQWPRPWLHCTPEPIPSHEQAAAGLHADIEGAMHFDRTRASAYAPRAGVIFSLERLGVVSVADARAMRELAIRSSIGGARPVTLSCAPDATSLLVLFETGDAELYRARCNAAGHPVALSLLHRFRYQLPEIDDPVAAWRDDAYWLQTRANALSRVDAATGAITEAPFPADVAGELAALVFAENGRRLLAVREPKAIVLIGTDGATLRCEHVDMSTACACGERVAVAFTDGHTIVYDVTTAPVAVTMQKAGIVRGAMGWDGERLLYLTESRDWNRFRGWNPTDNESVPIEDGQRLFPTGARTVPLAWDGTFVLTTHGAARFTLIDSGAPSLSRIVTLFGGEVWRALRMHERMQTLWEGSPSGSSREIRLTDDGRGRLYCAVDGRGYFYTARIDRPGLIWNLSTLETTPLRYLQVALNMAAGDPDKGCWFTDRTGGIYYTADDGVLHLAASVEEGVAPVVHVCGDHLVWRGYVDEWYDGSGVDRARTFVAFRRKTEADPPLERLGERRFAVRDGVCLAMDYDAPNNRMVMLWHREGQGPAVRLATVEEFLDGRWTDLDLDGVAGLGAMQIAVSPDGTTLAIVNATGAMVCVGLENGKEIARLAGSRSFTHVAKGGSGTSFWVAEQNGGIHDCTLVRPS